MKPLGSEYRIGTPESQGAVRWTVDGTLAVERTQRPHLCGARRGHDRVLEHPRAAQPRVPVDRRDLPLRLRAAAARAVRVARGPAVRQSLVARPPDRDRLGPVLRRRPDPLAPLDRRCRRRTRDGAGEHPGRARAAGGVGRARRKARTPGAGRAADRADRGAPDQRRARARRVRARPRRAARSTDSAPGSRTSASC